MRLLEILLVVANLVALIVLAVPLRGRARWAPYFALLPLLVAGVQVLVEGPRWQMVPAYVLSGLFLVALLFWPRRRRSGYEPGRRSLARRIAVGLGFGALGLLVLVAVLLPAILPVFHFPAPTGRYGIGTVIYHWVDHSRPEIFTPTPTDHRELMAQVWYPAEKNQTIERDPYVHDVDFSTTARKLGHLPPFLFDHWKYVVTNAQPSVAMADKGTRFPVLIFSPGRGGYRSVNTFQVEELVSHGYVVVGIDQPYSVADVAFPDGRHVTLDQRVVDFRSDGQDGPFKLAVDQVLGQDAVFALNQAATLDRSDPHGILTGRLDLDHVGVFGSSLGGITVAEACRMDTRFRACLGLDQAMPAAVVRSGLRQPTMWIVRAGTSDRTDEGWKPLATKELNTSVRSVYDRLPGDGYLVSIPNMFHSDITDLPNLIVQPLAGWAGLTGPGDWHQTHAAINAYSLAFFDKYLKGVPAPLLDEPAKQFPHVIFERR
jgi:predicted dienelactone hydrolase